MKVWIKFDSPDRELTGVHVRMTIPTVIQDSPDVGAWFEVEVEDLKVDGGSFEESMLAWSVDNQRRILRLEAALESAEDRIERREKSFALFETSVETRLKSIEAGNIGRTKVLRELVSRKK